MTNLIENILGSLFNGDVPAAVFILIWTLVLFVSIYLLVNGADIFVDGASKVGESLGMSRFAIGVLIVGFGTSLPEMASSIMAVLHGETTIVIANAVGSNITNILLIVGVLAALSSRIIIKKDLIRSELPVFLIATAHFIFVMRDGVVDRVESLLLLGTFAAYVWYLYSEARTDDEVDIMNGGKKPKLGKKSFACIFLGLVAVLLGAQFAVEMVINIATILSVPIGLVSITAIAIGTSLPELAVSLQAVKRGEQELAIGNIFGSNAFNILVVVGFSALLTPLHADSVVTELGIPVLAAASVFFFVNGLAKQMTRWEGFMYLLFFVFFLIKLTAFL